MNIPGRDVKPDIRHNSKLLAKLINYIMQEGKKPTSESIVYGALEFVEARSGSPALDVFNEAITNCCPRRSADPPRRRRELPGSLRSTSRSADRIGASVAGGGSEGARRAHDGRASGFRDRRRVAQRGQGLH